MIFTSPGLFEIKEIRFFGFFGVKGKPGFFCYGFGPGPFLNSKGYMWTTTSKIKFIQLEHRDTSVKEWINIDHIERFSDGEIYLNGKKYKVKESAKEIAQLITLEVVKA